MVGRGKDSVDEQKKVTKCHVFRCDNQIITAIDQKSMEGRTTTVERNAPEHTKKDPIDGVFKNGGQGWIRTTVVSRRQIYSLLPLATRAPTHIKFSINLPLTGFEPVASPLPRECATPAPQRLVPQGLYYKRVRL